MTSQEYAFGPTEDTFVGRLFTPSRDDDLTVTAGPVVRTDDAGMYAGYQLSPSDLLVDPTYGGAWATNNLTFGRYWCCIRNR